MCDRFLGFTPAVTLTSLLPPNFFKQCRKPIVGFKFRHSRSHTVSGISTCPTTRTSIFKIQVDRSIFTARKRSLRRLCFYTCPSVILFTWGVSRPTPRGDVEGSGRGGLQAHTQGEGGVSQHALRQTPSPHSRQVLLRAVRILLECILVIRVVPPTHFAHFAVN